MLPKRGRDLVKINTETYEQLKKYSEDIVYDDKENYTVSDWLDCYGANIRSEKDEEGNYNGFVTFGSVFAVAKMMERFRKQVVSDTLKMLVVEEIMDDKSS